MIARQDPGFVGDAGRVGTHGDVVAADFDDALGLALFLLNDVAEDAALFADKIFAAGAQFVEHAAWDEHGRGNLRRGMGEFLPGVLAVVLEEADVLDARVALEVEDALGGEAEEVCDLFVAGVPEMAVVARIFDQHFVRADGVHAVVDAVAAAAGIAFDAVKRRGMHDRARRPRNSRRIGRLRDHLRRSRGIGTETAGNVSGASVAGSSPVMTQERVMGSLRSSMDRKENTAEKRRQLRISCGNFLGSRCEMRRRMAARCFVIIRRSPLQMTEPSTPLMRQYAAVKKEHPTALLFFRLGDFYELFFDDAVVASKELQITLTSRNKEKGIAMPMCGVPYHAAEGYIGKLIRKGFKVAICEQMEDPRLAKKLVRREVTRVVTPGTAADSSLGSDENNFLAALAQVGDARGICGFGFVDRRVSGDGVFGRGRAAAGAGRVGAVAAEGVAVWVGGAAV